MRGSVLTLAVLCAAVAAPQCFAGVVYVNTNAPGNVHDGKSWGTAFTWIQPAIDAAKSGDQVWVAKGTYIQSNYLNTQVALYGGFAGTETASSQRDWKNNVTALDRQGGHDGSVSSYGQGAVIDGFAMRGGTGVAAYGGTVSVANCSISGGVVASGGSPSLSNCTFSGASTALWISQTTRAGTIAVSNCTFSGNREAVHTVGDTLVMTNCTLTGNNVGIIMSDTAAVTLTNCIVAFNQTGLRKAGSSTIALSYNDVYGNSSANFVGIADPSGTNGNISLDPKLSNGYHDVHIQPDSPCVDAGDDSLVKPGDTDVYGKQRIIGSHVDIGSDESDGTTWTVPSRTWYVSQAGNDANDGSSWTKAKKTVAGGLSVAQGTDEVWVAKGVYTESVALPTGVALYGGFEGKETARTQRDWTVNATVVTDPGNTNGSVISSSGMATTIDGFVVRGSGVGIGVQSGTSTVAHCIITGNSGYGLVSAGTVAVDNSTFSANGGGLSVSAETAFVTNCTLTSNADAGILVDQGTASISNCVVAFNRTGINRTATGTSPTMSHNDVFGNLSGNYVNLTDPTGSNGNISQDPKLSNPYHDIYLQPGSPCIDAGDDAVVRPGEIDAYGKPRVTGAHVDIGSDESDGKAWTVPAQIWYVSTAGDDANDGTSWNTAKKTVGGGLAAALGSDEIWVAQGAYVGRLITKSGVSLYGGFAGTEAARNERNWTTNVTVLDGGVDNINEVVTSTSLGGTVDGFTLQNGPPASRAYHGLAFKVIGGAGTIANCILNGFNMGISSAGAGVVLSNCTLSANYDAFDSFGPSTSQNGPSRISITDCLFAANKSGFTTNGGTADVTNTTFTGNTTVGFTANTVFGTCTISVSHCTFSGNSNGATIGTATQDATATASVTDSTFIGNTNSALGMSDKASATVYGCNFVRNGIGVGGATSVANSIFSGNGTGVDHAAGVTNCTISGNGTGIACNGTAATAVNCTISENAFYGVYLTSGRATLTNCIVAFNLGGIYRTSTSLPVTLSHNDVFSPNSGNYGNIADPTGTNGNISLDPRLSNPYHDIHIEPGSPCINAGTDAVVKAGSTDIYGKPRIIGAHVDIGSDESDGTNWVVPSKIWRVSPTGDDANDGSTWNKARKTLTATLSSAQGTDEVWVAKGTYSESVKIPAGVSLYGGFTGTETSRGQRDWNANAAIVDGGGAVPIRSPFLSVTLDGLTVRNGPTGIGIESGTATVANCTVTQTPTYGVYVGNGYGTVTNCVISSAGSGLYVYGGGGTLTNCVLNGNRTGVRVYGTATVTNCDITGNSSQGVQVTSGLATFTGCKINGNASDGFYQSGGVAKLTNCAINGNSKNGVYLDSGTATVINCTISGNTSSGALLSSGSATVKNCINAFNNAGLTRASVVTLTLSNTDIHGNSAYNYLGLTDPTGVNGNISSDPLFENQSAGDYHLKAGSPCIDAGTDSVLTTGETDLEGNPRKVGTHVDMGAYEWQAPKTWSISLGTPVTGGVTVAERIAYVAGNDGKLYARSTVNGSTISGFPVDINAAIGATVKLPSRPAVYYGKTGKAIYLTTDRGDVVRVLPDGTVAWHVRALTGQTVSTPAVTPDGFVFVNLSTGSGPFNNYVFKLDEATGTPLSLSPFLGYTNAGDLGDFSPAANERYLYVNSGWGSGQGLTLLNQDNLTVRSSFAGGEQCLSPLLVGSDLILATRGGKAYKMNAVTMNPDLGFGHVGVADIGSPLSAAPFSDAPGNVYVGTADGRILKWTPGSPNFQPFTTATGIIAGLTINRTAGVLGFGTSNGAFVQVPLAQPASATTVSPGGPISTGTVYDSLTDRFVVVTDTGVLNGYPTVK